MKRQEDVFKKFYDSFRNMDGRFHILEHRIPVEQQLDYFRYSEKMKKYSVELNDHIYEQYTENLDNTKIPMEDKKMTLSHLASSKQVRAYRMIERYAQNPDEGLVNWAHMALMEGRITLESELLGEKQVYISTGLGGKGESIRFYVLILSFEGKVLEDYQREVIEKEFGYYLPKKNCEIERLTIGDKYVELVFLIPIRTDIKAVLEEAIQECNLYGNFLSGLFTITNVKELTREEVGEIIEKNDTNY